MSQDNSSDIISKIENASDEMEISLILDSLDEDIIDTLLSNPDMGDIYRARIALLENEDDFLIGILEEIGYNITRDYLFEKTDEFVEIRQDIFRELIFTFFDLYQADLQLESKSKTTDEITKDMFDSLLYDSSSYNPDSHIRRINQKRQKVILSLISSLRDLDFIKRKIETSYFLDETIHNALKKQILLILSPELQVENYQGITLFDKIVQSNIDWFESNVGDISNISFHVILDLVDMHILTNKNKLIISEFNNQEQLIQLYRLEPLQHDRDLIVAKLNESSIIRLISDYRQHDIIHYIDNRETLREIFYKIDSIIVKASIAKLLENDDLAFEVVDLFLHNPEDEFIPRHNLKELLILLNKKQLALLRMTSPSKYQQYILQIVEDKERRDDHDNAMFA